MGENSNSEVGTNKLYVKVMDLESVLYEGSASSLSSINDKGPFDILPLHANFITLIEKSVSIEQDSRNRQTFDIATGVLICKQNQVRIYLGF